ncbi:hypothetical protein C1H46_036925 [Malus baccata]|uniref:Uncharacterized protein n=1 Tax=Malus baccata TaxID=106549 RepID=A0A540KTI0_MALBA|nr:hypothetical protein C1H46_036925 [Malus baccata]
MFAPPPLMALVSPSCCSPLSAMLPVGVFFSCASSVSCGGLSFSKLLLGFCWVLLEDDGAFFILDPRALYALIFGVFKRWGLMLGGWCFGGGT